MAKKKPTSENTEGIEDVNSQDESTDELDKLEAERQKLREEKAALEAQKAELDEGRRELDQALANVKAGNLDVLAKESRHTKAFVVFGIGEKAIAAGLVPTVVPGVPDESEAIRRFAVAKGLKGNEVSKFRFRAVPHNSDQAEKLLAAQSA